VIGGSKIKRGFRHKDLRIFKPMLGYGGHFFGHAFEIVLDDAKKYEIWVFGLIAIISIQGWRIFHLKRRRRPAPVETQPPGIHPNSK
jgi:hypothetical protein